MVCFQLSHSLQRCCTENAASITGCCMLSLKPPLNHTANHGDVASRPHLFIRISTQEVVLTPQKWPKATASRLLQSCRGSKSPSPCESQAPAEKGSSLCSWVESLCHDGWLITNGKIWKVYRRLICYISLNSYIMS